MNIDLQLINQPLCNRSNKSFRNYNPKVFYLQNNILQKISFKYQVNWDPAVKKVSVFV